MKFKPKMVARRSKEERDANAPTIVPEAAVPLNRTTSTRGRGGMRGGRGGRNGMDRNAGTHTVSSGPLSSGVVIVDSHSARKAHDVRRLGNSPAPDFIKNLKPKERSLSPLSDDEDAFVVDGDTKINMSEEYTFEDSQTELFPVRADRSDHKDPGEQVVVKEETREVTPVKLEEGEVEEIKLIVDPQSTLVSSEESSRLANDHRIITELLQKSSISSTDQDGDTDMEIQETPNQFFFLQLPKVLPAFKAKDNQDTEDKEQDKDINGQVGTLRYHKSGKITMKLGNIVFEVSRGGESEFLQDVVYVKESEPNPSNNDAELGNDPEIHHLGQIIEKIVVTPKMDNV